MESIKKILAVAVVTSLVLLGCIKNADLANQGTSCTPVTIAAEQPQILAFLAKDSLAFKQDTSGVYYHIDTAGTGVSATVNSTVSFTYTAWLLDGTFIASSTMPIEYPLGNTIPGFIAMAPYFKKGTHILMVIPSSLAYGCQGLSSGSINVGSNSVLYYDLTITAVQ